MKNWKYIEGAKTGNDTPLEYAHRKPKVINEDLKSYSEVLEKAKRELEKVKEKEKMADSIKSKEEWASARREIEDKIKYYQSRIGNDDKTGAEEFFKQLSDDVKEREEKDDADIEKVGNLSKDELLKELDAEEKLLKVLKERGGEKGYGTNPILYRDAERRIQDLKNKLNKIGNKVGNQSPQERLNQDLSIIKEECRKKGISLSFSELAKELEKYGWDFNELRKLKLPVSVGNALNWDENLVGKFVWVKDKGQEWKVYVMQDKGDKVYIRDDDGSQGWVSKTRITGKVGNSKIGNSTVSEYNAEIQRLTKKAEQLRRMGQGKSAMEVEKQIEKLGKELAEVGNAASDDKFAYVMREFDEGKLKTPDGKVVTDPAQAKAIAYSESKKTENGLARARNAIKKY